MDAGDTSQTAAAIDSYKTGPLDNNVYIIRDDAARQVAVVDPGIDAGHILRALRERGLTITAIVNTHGHFDHVAGVAAFVKESGAPIYRHPLDEEIARRAGATSLNFGLQGDDSPPTDHTLNDGDTYTFGPHAFRVLHVPGHSPGSVVLVADGVMIGGDVLFRGSIGRTDLPGGSLPLLLQGIRDKVLTLDDDVRVLPGHGPETTIGRERRSNPFLERE